MTGDQDSKESACRHARGGMTGARFGAGADAVDAQLLTEITQKGDVLAGQGPVPAVCHRHRPRPPSSVLMLYVPPIMPRRPPPAQPRHPAGTIGSARVHSQPAP